MAAESNGARNPAFKVTNAASTGKSIKLNNKRSHEATKQNGPVEGEETLAAAGASADAKEFPPEKCRKSRDVQDISYHGQDMQAVGGNESVSMEVTTEEQVTSQDRTVRAGQSEGEDVADSEDRCSWTHVEDDSSETKVNKNQSHKRGNQPSKDSLPTQRYLVSFGFGRGRLPANSSQDERGRVVEKDKSHDATSSRKSSHSRSHDRSHDATSSRKSNHSRSLDRSHDATSSRKSSHSRSLDRSHDATSSRKSNHSRSHDRSHDATSSRKNDHSRSCYRSCYGAKGGVQDRSYSGSQHSSQGCDNQEEDWRYWENAKKEGRQQKKCLNDQRSAIQQQAQGGKKNKNKKNQKEDNQNRPEWILPERPPRQGEPIELVEVKGDLFSCPATDAMACCVSEDLAMGKGIAVRFKEPFRGVGELRAQAKQVGDVATLYRDGKYVYYLIIKKRYFHKPTYQTLESSLTAMKNHMVEHKVTHLSMPTIGCGLDRLVWDVVAYIIRRVFHGTGIQITVYHYDGK